MPDRDEKRLTMQDLARRAGVAPITVSRALAGSPAVKPATRDKVRKIAEAMGYQFNVAARNLRLQHTSNIAVVIEMIPSRTRPMSEPYPLSLLGGIIEELSIAGYSAMLSTAANFTRVPPAVDAVILLGQGTNDDAVPLIERCKLPLVVWGSIRNDGGRHLVVGSDNLAGGRLAGERVSQLARRGAIFLGDTHYAEVADRLDGFERALADHGGQLLDAVACDFTLEGGHAAMEQALARHGSRIDAVFAASDAIAMGAVRALIEAGRQVPQQVTVIGFDDAASARLFVPPLTTIRQDWHEGGRLLARKALAVAKGDASHSEQLAVSLITRET